MYLRRKLSSWCPWAATCGWLALMPGPRKANNAGAPFPSPPGERGKGRRRKRSSFGGFGLAGRGVGPLRRAALLVPRRGAEPVLVIFLALVDVQPAAHAVVAAAAQLGAGELPALRRVGRLVAAFVGVLLEER